MSKASRRLRVGSWVWWAVLFCALIVIGRWPVTTRLGIDYQWSSQRIPLYEKAVNFLSRDLQIRRLAREITAGASSQGEKLLRIFSWVTTTIRPVPEGFPVVDDHIFHIIVRGYGAEDQRTEAFVTLAGYAGFQARVARLEPPHSPGNFLFVALVRCGTKTYVFDVNHRILFRDEHDHLADVDQLLVTPQLVDAAAQGLVVHGVPYHQYFLGLDRAKVSSRTQAQQLWPRVKQELEHLLRFNVVERGPKAANDIQGS